LGVGGTKAVSETQAGVGLIQECPGAMGLHEIPIGALYVKTLKLSSHTKDMLLERNILEEWVLACYQHNQMIRSGKPKMIICITTKAIKERNGRVFARCCKSKCFSPIA